MIVNFRTHEISRDTQKSARTPTLIKKKQTILPSRSQTINLFYITYNILMDTIVLYHI
jgi:hypothetical protein